MSKKPNPHDRHGSATETSGEIIVARGGYAITEKMRWRTPPWLYAVLDAEFGFDLDACSEDVCALAPRWITAEEDALEVDWRFTFRQRIGGEIQLVQIDDHSPVKAAFINPPWAASHTPAWVKEEHPGVAWAAFPGTEAFVRKAYQMSRAGVVTACLIPQAFDAKWFKPLVKLADEVRVGSRFRFSDHRGRLGPQPPGGHCLLVYRPHAPAQGWPGGPRVDWDWDPQPQS